jgi:transcriptional regulator GlxA family with amidase domain
MRIRLDRVTDWQKRAKAARYRVKELAEYLGVTTRCLEVYWARKRRKTVKAWLAQMKLQVAKRQLSQGIPVWSVAAQVGYGNPANFCRWFKTVTGHSPTGKP